MARQAFTKPADPFGLRHSGFDILERVQHFIQHPAPQANRPQSRTPAPLLDTLLAKLLRGALSTLERIQ